MSKNSNIRLINPQKKRHVHNGKMLINDVCNCIEDSRHAVAGYAILVWNDAGNTSIALMSGCPIGLDVAPTFIKDKFQQLIKYN